MYFRDLNCSEAQALMPQAAILRLPMRIGTRNPETAIVRPVARRLDKRGLARVTAWQVWTEGEGEVRGVEMSLDLGQPTRAGLTAVADALRLAPIGSSVRFRAGGDPLVFGGSEAVEVSLPPVDPAKSRVAARCSEALGRRGRCAAGASAPRARGFTSTGQRQAPSSRICVPFWATCPCIRARSQPRLACPRRGLPP